MRQALADLLRNLVAGARLATGLGVSALSFRASLSSLLALLAFNVALDIALGWVRIGPGAHFTYVGMSSATIAIAAFLLVTAIVAIALSQLHLLLTVPVLAFAASPLLHIAYVAYRTVFERPGRHAALAAFVAWIVLMVWQLFVLARVFVLALAPRQPHFRLRVAASVALLVGSAYGVQTLFGERDWWYPPEPLAGSRFDYSAAVSEQALAKQPALLSAAIAGLAPQRPGVVDLYFVGFAPYATQDVFRNDVEMAYGVVSQRFDGAARSIVLINHPRTVLESPLATVSNLGSALKAVGERMDRDEDIVLVFLTSHGSKDHTLAAYFPPLQLDSLAPRDLRSMLDDAGIRWRIVVVSACYSGGFIPALADDHTLVLTAAAANRTSFGCADDSELTYFTDALFNQAMRRDVSLPAAFEQARAIVAERERAEGLAPPSDPQMSLGAAIANKLPALERRLRAGGA